jgi:signal transduction histidine kinase
MRWPLRHQIMLPLVVVALASLLAVGVINAWLAARHTRERIEAQLQGTVRVLATSSFPLSDAVLRQMRGLSSAEFVVTDQRGALLATSFDEDPGELPPIEPVSRSKDLELGSPVMIHGQRYFHAASSLPARGPSAEPTKLHVLFPGREYSRNWREALWPSLTVGVVTVAAVALVARLLAGRIGRVTSRLGGEVLRMAGGDFTAAHIAGVDDEIRDLAVSVNRMAEMLAAYEQEVRRTEQMRTAALLGAGLAHEMRNAATGCRMALDLHAEHCTGNGAAESLEVAKRQLQLMETQLQRFLRAGKPTAGAPAQWFDLRSLVEEMLALVRPAAKHAGAEVHWTAPAAEVAVLADREALGQVALNLLLNAVEAVQKAPRDAPRRIRATLQSTDGNAELLIADTGPGPAVGEAIFDPFVTSKPEGVGLGLAVAREIIAAHQGAIHWSRTPSETEFRVRIPVAGTLRVP